MSTKRYADSIHIGDIATPLSSATTFEAITPMSEAMAVLERLGFDQAPVTDKGDVIGYVRRTALADSADPVAEVLEPVWPKSVIAWSTPLGDALPHLAHSGFLFCLDRREVTGFVVPWDVNKQSGRAWCFLVLAELEIEMANALRRSIDDQSALFRTLDKAREGKLTTEWTRLQKGDADADPLSIFGFSDVLTAGIATLPFADEVKQTWRDEALMKELRNLRNGVMHGARDMVSKRRPLQQAVEMVGIAESLLGNLRSLPVRSATS